MIRRLDNWIKSYLSYTDGTEPPRMMHFFVGVSVLAGALRRHVWVDMKRFKWHPNFYIILVAPPGIISKTTTMDHGIDLLRSVPDINFGPDAITWQALATRFAESREEFFYGEEFIPQSAMTLASGELGNLITPIDKEMVNLYISLWDGRNVFEKETKMSGNDQIHAPWINMIGCTTPHWIGDNFPEAMIGGGFVSRCIFVYADEKDKRIAWPDEAVRDDHEQIRYDLIHDLVHISQNLVGPMKLMPDAREWGRAWYDELWTEKAKLASSDQLQGYLARKQTHMVKLALILSISESDSLEITQRHMQLANEMLFEVEQSSGKVFGRIGQTQQGSNSNRLLEFIRRYGEVTYKLAYRHVLPFFPDAHEFEGVVKGLVDAGYVKFKVGMNSDKMEDSLLAYCGPEE